MKNILKFIPALLVCAFITSCQKELANTQDPVIPPVITPQDSVTRLAKIIFIDYRASDTDTTGYREYIYDSLQRVTTLKAYYYNNGITELEEVVTYFYTNNDSMAYKMIYEEKDVAQSYFETHFYSYDNLKRLINDSAIYSSTEVGVSQYSYSASSIAGMYRYTDASDPLNNNVYKDTGFIGSSGDVIKTNTLTGRSDPISGYVEYYITAFTYDNNPNPFYQLNIRSTYSPLPGFDFYLESLYLQKNNVVSSTEHEPLYGGPTDEDTDTYTYTYNTSGLPASVDVAFGFGQIDDYRIVFVYKKI